MLTTQDENGNHLYYDESRRINEKVDRDANRDAEREPRRRQLIPIIRETDATGVPQPRVGGDK